MRKNHPVEREMVYAGARISRGKFRFPPPCLGLWEHRIKRNKSLLKLIFRFSPDRYLDPDPMLLATTREQEGNTSNPRFHSLNQAIVQLVGIYSYYPGCAYSVPRRA